MLAVVETNGGAAPQADRRNGTRQRLLLRSAKLRCLSGEYPCVIYDVSETGARLRMFQGHMPDSHMFLELANGNLYAIERRWIDGDFGGFRFSSRVETDEFIHDQHPQGRRPLRLRMTHPVQISGRVSGAPASWSATLANLSQQGACIETGLQVAVGAPLRIELPGRVPRFAHVCWRKEGRYGIAFQDAQTLAEFARLALELQPYGAEPAMATASAEPAQAISA